MAITAQRRLTAAEIMALPVAERETYLRERRSIARAGGVMLSDPNLSDDERAEAEALKQRLLSLRAQRRGD